MAETESRNVGIRFDPEFSAWLANFEGRTGIGAVSLGRALFSAAREFYDEHNYLVFPIEIVVSPQRKNLVAASIGAEDPPQGAALEAAMKDQTARSRKLLDQVAEPPKLHIVTPPAEESSSTGKRRKQQG